MKKIGILTFHRAVNYGAVLQAYSLVTCLQELGCDVEIIDYRNKKIESTYYSIVKTIPRSNIYYILKSTISNVLNFHIQRKRNIEFKNFIQEYCKMSKHHYTKKTIYQANALYDLFLVGSDQVWNLPCIDGDKTYFLDFADERRKKYSYAASFGKIDSIKEDYKSYFALLGDFFSISVREVDGKNFIQNNIKERVRVDIDPVFLLSDKKWLALEIKPDIRDYILVYSVDFPSGVISYARNLARAWNKQLVIVTLRNNKVRLLGSEIDRSCCSPREFIGLIDHSNLVVTNSFHGVALSIVFNTNFIVVRNSKSSFGLDNSRLDNILNTFNLVNRYSDQVNPQESIDFVQVENKLNELKEHSMDYLRLIQSIE